MCRSPGFKRKLQGIGQVSPYSSALIGVAATPTAPFEALEKVGLLHDAKEFLLIHFTIAITVSFIDHLCSSSSVIRSPNSLATRFKFLNEIFPVSSSSKRRKAFKISSLGSRPC